MPETRYAKMAGSVPQAARDEAEKLGVKNLDLGDLKLEEWMKKAALAGVDFFQAVLLPKIQAKNPTLGLVVAGLLDALERSLNG